MRPVTAPYVPYGQWTFPQEGWPGTQVWCSAHTSETEDIGHGWNDE